MNGLLLKDTEIIHGMDKTDAATYIPVKIKAGEPVSSTSLATLAEFGKIFKKVDMLIAEMGKNIYSGNIEAKPLKGGHDSCEYCPYDSVCAYRQSNPITCFLSITRPLSKKLQTKLTERRKSNVKKLTPQQKNAIYATDGSVFVSAAAGSGKTAVLVERVIKLITREKNPLDVDRLLIVTFTRRRLPKCVKEYRRQSTNFLKMIRITLICLHSDSFCTVQIFLQ